MQPSKDFPFYHGKQSARQADQPARIPSPKALRPNRPEAYLTDSGLVDAVNVALMLGQPLLVTGEPGTGKTQLADSVSWELGFGDALRFKTKSNSQARELFYIFNSIGRFHAAQTGSGSQDNRDYITYNALGTAILRTLSPEDVAAFAVLEHEQPRRSVEISRPALFCGLKSAILADRQAPPSVGSGDTVI